MTTPTTLSPSTTTPSREALYAQIEAAVAEHYAPYREAAQAIHAHPETSNHEVFACDTLTRALAANGFTITVDVAGHPTGFTATYASGKPGPVLVFLAEYDALAGLGHGCGHNLFGATSSLAAVALKAVIDRVGGEVRVYGTPGEEGGENGSAKGSFVRDGYFADCDAALCVHPGSRGHRLSDKSIACAPVTIEFFGKPAHAAGSPEKGINALDGLILTYNGLNALRQHVTPDVRIHGIITHGGTAPNVVPEYARALFYLRAATAPTLEALYQRALDVVAGAAAMTGARGVMQPSQNRVDNMVVTPRFDAIYARHLLAAGEVLNTEPRTSMGSSDVGNVSQVIPTIQPSISITDTFVTPHSQDFCDAAISEKGLASIALGAKLLAKTALDLILEPETLAAIKAEHRDAVAHQNDGV